MKSYWIRCKKCVEGMVINVPNARFKEIIQQSEFICTKCVSGISKDELYQPEALHG